MRESTKYTSSRPGYVYFAKSGNRLKIGSTNNLIERLRNISSKNETYGLVHVLQTDDRYRVERIMHTAFRQFKLWSVASKTESYKLWELVASPEFQQISLLKELSLVDARRLYQGVLASEDVQANLNQIIEETIPVREARKYIKISRAAFNAAIHSGSIKAVMIVTDGIYEEWRIYKSELPFFKIDREQREARKATKCSITENNYE